MKKLLLLLIAFFIPLCGFAQGGLIEAWTRGLTLSVRDGLVARTVFAPQAGGAVFFEALNPATTPRKIVSTPDNMVYSVVYYSDVFSKKEKSILLPREPQGVKLGKIAVIHDQSASLYNQIQHENNPQKLFSQHAFEEHQRKLAELASTLENGLVSKTQVSLDFRAEKDHEDFVSLLQKMPSGFIREDIARLVQSAGQPLFPVMGRKEIQQFAALDTIEAQRQWVAQSIDAVKSNQQALLSRDLTAFTDSEYRLYYMQNLRLKYLQGMQGILTKAQTPRKSLIYRRRMRLKENLPLMTDAERLGYLQYHLDTFTGSAAEREALENSLKQQKDLYQAYAVAEALDLPYERVLDKGYMSPELLGAQEGENIRQAADLPTLLAPKIEALDQQLAAMREFEPEETSFLRQYYRLTIQRNIYQAELARRHLFDGFR